MARVMGPIVGTIIFWFTMQFTDNMLDQATRDEWLPTWLVDSSPTTRRSSSSSPASR